MNTFLLNKKVVKAMAAVCHTLDKEVPEYQQGLNINNGWAWVCDGFFVLAHYHGQSGKGFVTKKTLQVLSSLPGNYLVTFDIESQTIHANSFTGCFGEYHGLTHRFWSILGKQRKAWENTRFFVAQGRYWKMAEDFIGGATGAAFPMKESAWSVVGYRALWLDSYDQPKFLVAVAEIRDTDTHLMPARDFELPFLADETEAK